MRKIFSIDMSNSKNGRFDGEDLAIRRVSGELLEKWDSLTLELDRAMREYKRLPSWLSILRFITLISGIGLLWAIISALTAGGSFLENLKNGFANAPYIFILCPIMILIFILLAIYEKKYINKQNNEEIVRQFEEKQRAMMEEIKSSLGVPDDALTVDVLCFAYKYDKRGELCQYSPYATHTPMEVFLFKEGEDVCIATVNSVFAFPKESFRGIVERTQKIKLLCWNKEEAPNEEGYAEYGMCYDNYGIVQANGYYSLIFNLEGPDVELDVPSYEAETFKKIFNQ